jgi:hypothetical protein
MIDDDDREEAILAGNRALLNLIASRREGTEVSLDEIVETVFDAAIGHLAAFGVVDTDYETDDDVPLGGKAADEAAGHVPLRAADDFAEIRKRMPKTDFIGPLLRDYVPPV